jgi:Family of unknown function (DUF6489)
MRPVKITMNVDCSPEEVRQMLGLPDLGPMQQRLLSDLEERLRANVQAMEPENLMKAWMPMGVQGFEQVQRFWANFANMARESMAGNGGKDGE